MDKVFPPQIQRAGLTTVCVTAPLEGPEQHLLTVLISIPFNYLPCTNSSVIIIAPSATHQNNGRDTTEVSIILHSRAIEYFHVVILPSYLGDLNSSGWILDYFYLIDLWILLELRFYCRADFDALVIFLTMHIRTRPSGFHQGFIPPLKQTNIFITDYAQQLYKCS